MTKLTRAVQKVFADSAASNEIEQIGSLRNGTPVYTKDPATLQALAQYAGGLVDIASADKFIPALEDINAIYFLLTRQLAYIMQEGVPEWDADTTYYQNSIVKKTGTTDLYYSRTDSNTNHALTDTTYWLNVGGGGQIPLGGYIGVGVGITGADSDATLIAKGFAKCNGSTPASQGVVNPAITISLPNINAGAFIRGNVTAWTTGGASGGADTINLVHAHTSAAHTHAVASHVHSSAAHTHTVASHVHVEAAHTHTINSHTHTSAAHTHTVATHSHTSAAHIHTMGSHTHTLTNHVHTNSGTTGAGTSHSHGPGTLKFLTGFWDWIDTFHADFYMYDTGGVARKLLTFASTAPLGLQMGGTTAYLPAISYAADVYTYTYTGSGATAAEATHTHAYATNTGNPTTLPASGAPSTNNTDSTTPGATGGTGLTTDSATPGVTGGTALTTNSTSPGNTGGTALTSDSTTPANTGGTALTSDSTTPGATGSSLSAAQSVLNVYFSAVYYMRVR